MKKVIFWDWTGCLVNERRLDKAVCRNMEKLIAEKRGISEKRARQQYSNLLDELIGTWRWHDYLYHSKCFDVDFSGLHTEETLKNLILYPYAKEILEFSRSEDYKNCLATNAVREVFLARANYADLTKCFDLVICSSDVKALKSEGKHFLYGLKRLNGDPESSFSIGDSLKEDILPAKKLSMKSVLMVRETKPMFFYTKEEEKNYYFKTGDSEPDYRVNELKELEKIL